MKLQIKPHPWSCLATSFAMALDISVDLFHELAGHDGSEILFPWLPDPLCRRGFHASEAMYVVLCMGKTATAIEVLPQIASTPLEKPSINATALYGNGSVEWNWTIFKRLISSTRGVLETRTRRGNWHAVAYENGRIFDPDGASFNYSKEDCELRGLYTTRLWSVK